MKNDLERESCSSNCGGINGSISIFYSKGDESYTHMHMNTIMIFQFFAMMII